MRANKKAFNKPHPGYAYKKHDLFAPIFLFVSYIMITASPFRLVEAFCLIGNPNWIGDPSVSIINKTDSNLRNIGKIRRNVIKP